MLVLTRRLSESIIINDNISVTVIGVKGCQVRLGIEAPKDISVHREEIWLRIKEEEEDHRGDPLVGEELRNYEDKHG